MGVGALPNALGTRLDIACQWLIKTLNVVFSDSLDNLLQIADFETPVAAHVGLDLCVPLSRKPLGGDLYKSLSQGLAAANILGGRVWRLQLEGIEPLDQAAQLLVAHLVDTFGGARKKYPPIRTWTHARV